MFDFFKDFFSHAGQIFETLACSVFLWKWNQLTKLETWTALLIFSYLFFDAMATALEYHRVFQPGETNQWIYNIGIFPQVAILFYIYFHLLSNRKLRLTIKYGSFFFISFYFINILYIQKDVLNTYTYVPAMACIAAYSFAYLKQTVEIVEMKPFQNFFFWFSVAIFIEYTASTPLIGTLSWFAFTNQEIVNRLYYVNDYIYSTSLLIISLGLLWTKKKQTLPFSL